MCGLLMLRLSCGGTACQRVGGRRMTRILRSAGHRALWIQQVVVIGTQPELDQGACIGNCLALPSIVRLVFLKSLLGSIVPFPGRIAVEVMLTDQRFLNLLCPLGIDLLLPSRASVRDLSRLFTRARGLLPRGMRFFTGSRHRLRWLLWGAMCVRRSRGVGSCGSQSTP